MGERTMNTWLGLLKWSLNYHDGTKPIGADSDAPSTAKPMSDADRAWLMAALKAHTVDEAERMKLIRSILAVPDDAHAIRQALVEAKLADELHNGAGGVGGAVPSAADAKHDADVIALGVSEKLKALDELDERVETIDNALDYFKIGGFEPLRNTLLNLQHPELVWRAAQVFSTICQNNPKCQAQAVEKRLLDALLPLLDLFQTGTGAAAVSKAAAPAAAAAATGSADVKADTPAAAAWNAAAAALTPQQRERIVSKALLATSSLVRDNAAALAQFLGAQGNAVARLLRVAGASTAASGLRRKAVSLLRHILSVAVETQSAAAQSAAIASAGPSAGVKVTLGERGAQRLGGVTITGGPAAAAAPAAAAGGAAAAAAAAAAGAAPAKTDVRSATAAVNGLKQSIVSAGGIGVLTGLIDFGADVDLRTGAVELLNDLLSGAPEAVGAAAALAVLKAEPTHSTASKAISARVDVHRALQTNGLNVTDPKSADAVDDIRAAYAELQLLWRLVQFAFPELVKGVGAEYRRMAVVVAKADAEDRKRQAAAAAARGVGSVYSTSQAAPTHATHSNTDTPIAPTPLLK